MAGGAGPCWIPAGSGLAQATWLVYPHLLQGDLVEYNAGSTLTSKTPVLS